MHLLTRCCLLLLAGTFCLYWARVASLAVNRAPALFDRRSVDVHLMGRQVDRLNALFSDPVLAGAVRHQMAAYNDYRGAWQPQTKDRLGVPNFKCPAGQPSTQVPTSVHALTPGDVRVIGAIGDSLTAGNGAKAWNIVELLFNYRGQAFTAGGDDDLSKLTTLPNILRYFNPDLFGYATGISSEVDYELAHFNVAVEGAEAGDLAEQAHHLLDLMTEKLSNDSFHNDWKMIVVFIGGNDLCRYCTDKVMYAADAWASRIASAIGILQAGLPRVLFNVVGPIHVELSRKLSQGHIVCEAVHTLFECPCLQKEWFTYADFYNITLEYARQAEQQLVASGQFERQDATVVLQPFLVGASEPPRDANGTLDLSFVAPDCFHLSSKGHDHFAKFFWNNMLEPVGAKTPAANLSDVSVALNCPDPDCPYIRTTGNSKTCLIEAFTFGESTSQISNQS